MVSSKYILNPYDGDIFPGEAAGAKLYQIATQPEADESKRFSITASDSLPFRNALTSACSRFGWGGLVTAVPLSYDATTNDPDSFGDILTNPDAVPMDMVIFNAGRTWSSVDYATKTVNSRNVASIDPGRTATDRPVFQTRLKSSMIAEWVEGHIDQPSWKMIQLCSSYYQWSVPAAKGGGFRNDGPTLLKILFELMDPSTEIGTEEFRKTIQNARLSNYKYNVNEALNEVEHSYQKIVLRNETYDSLRLHIFDLLLSAKNDEFLQWVRRVKQDVNTGSGEYKNFTAQQLILAARKQYNNMAKSGSWDKVDPRDAQFAAMATQIQQLQAAQAAHATSGGGHTGGNNSGSNGGGSKKYQVEEWMTKKTEDQIWWNGKPWWWCTNHNDGKGMYVRHPPSDHSKWKQAKDEKKRYVPPRIDKPLAATTTMPPSQPSASGTSGSSGASQSNSSTPGMLELNSELKQVLASFGLSDHDAESVWNQAYSRASSKN